MHAVALAEELKVPKVIVPVNSSVFSAWGMLLTDLRRDYLQTYPMDLKIENEELISESFHKLMSRARTDYSQDGVDFTNDIIFEFHADLRYAGQEHTVKVSFPFCPDDGVNLAKAIDSFHDAHEKRFTYRLNNAVQLVNFHLVAKVEVPKPELVKKQDTGKELSDTILHSRQVDYDQHGIHEAAVYDGLQLQPRMSFTGPAIIQEPSATLVISPEHRAEVDDYGNYIVHLSFAGKGA